MRLISSIVFLFGALSVGAYAYFPDTVTYDRSSPNVVEIGAATDPIVGQDMIRRSFAPDSSAFRAATRRILIADTGTTSTVLGVGKSPAALPAPVVAPSSWRAVPTTSNEIGSQRHRVGAPAAHSHAHYELVRNLQTELRRVGCYGGEIDSDWGAGSRRAAEQFLAKVNATLPTETPDYILLTLIQGHVDKACDVDCPSGQGLAADGRCVSNAIVAQGPERGSLLGRKSIGRAIDAWQTKATAATVNPAPGALTAVARAPLPANPNHGQRPAPVLAKKQIAGMSAGSAPAQSAEPQQQPKSIEVLPRPMPLPGRMAIGAPSWVDADAIAVAPTTTPAPSASRLDTPVTKRAPLGESATFTSPQSGVAAGGTATAALAAAPSPDSNGAGAMTPAATSITGAPSQNVATPSTEPPRKAKRASRPYHERPAPRGERQRYSARDTGTVRTHQGKVRRGSPQHNLMLSLGGVF